MRKHKQFYFEGGEKFLFFLLQVTDEPCYEARLLHTTATAICSSGLKTTNFKFMTKDNKQQKLSDSTNTAIAYSTCYVSLIFLNFFWGGIFYV